MYSLISYIYVIFLRGEFLYVSLNCLPDKMQSRIVQFFS